jgi:hypothetical protein
MVVQSLILIIVFIFSLFFVNEGFGIKLESILTLIFSGLPLLIGILVAIIPQYVVVEKYFPAILFLDFALVNINFFTVSLPIIKTFYWTNKKIKNQNHLLGKTEISQELKIQLMKELVEGRDPNTNSNYVMIVLSFHESMELFKQFAIKEIASENVKLLLYNII